MERKTKEMNDYNQQLKYPTHPSLDGLDELAKKFIVMCYHKDSDIVMAYKDKLEERWSVAKQKTGFKGEAELLYSNIADFLQSQNNTLWQQYCSCQSLFQEYQKLIIKPLDNTTDDDKLIKSATLKSKLVLDSDILIDKMASYLDKIFEKDKKLIEYQKRKPITPENVIKMLSVD